MSEYEYYFFSSSATAHRFEKILYIHIHSVIFEKMNAYVVLWSYFYNRTHIEQ